MQEINLLQNKVKDDTAKWKRDTQLLTIVLVVLLVLEAAGFGFLYLSEKKNVEAQEELQKESAAIQKELSQRQESLGEAKVFQAQAQNIETLLRSHVIWTGLLNELSSSTYKQARFMNLSTDTGGVIHVEGFTSSYTDLGKLLLSLETSEYVNSVKLNSTAPSTGQLAGITYSLDINVDRSILLEK